MSRLLEVGLIGVAGLASCILYNSMSSTQERLDSSRNAQLDKVEEWNRVAIDYRLELDLIRDATRQQRYAAQCYKSRTCTKMAEAVYFEDRGGGIDGMQAVANVIINRMNSNRFPKTVVGVINQRKMTKRGWVCQFSYVCQLKDLTMYDEDSKIKAGFVAWKATNGILRDRTNGADHYLNKSKVKTLPAWVFAFNKTVKIGAHTFYATKEI